MLWPVWLRTLVRHWATFLAGQPPILGADNWSLIRVLERCIEAIILAMVVGRRILAIVILVFLFRLVAAFTRVGSDRRQVRRSHFILVNLWGSGIESYALWVSLK
jgi:hypothetical protein